MLQQVISVALLAFVAATPPAVSQGIPRNSCGVCSTQTVSAPADRVVIATPFVNTPADSASAVQLGYALRDRVAKNINGSDWRVTTTQEMNTNLMNYGYGRDAILAPDPALALASQLNYKVFVMTTLVKGSDGHFNASSRVISRPGNAGYVIKLAQAPGQSLPDFGSKIGDQVALVFKAYADGRQCLSNETTAPAKAVDAAAKALKTLPNYGLAEYCLGEMAQAKDSTSTEAQKHYHNALIGDPQSLRSVQSIAAIDLKRNDTTAVVEDFKQMITVAPTDRTIADNAYKVFSQFGRPDAAAQVVAQQIALDPTNPDWQDLKGNSCAAAAVGAKDPAVAKTQFACAFDAFQTVVKLDPTRADTDFYQKIVYVAPTAQDSLVWAQRFAAKYSSSIDPLKLEAQIYVSMGELDSAVKVVNIILKVDPTEARSAITVSNAMIDAKRPEGVFGFVPYFQKQASEADRNTFAGLVISKVLQPLAQATPRQDSLLVVYGQAMVDLAPTGPNLAIYANYFMAIGLADQLKPLSDATRAAKNCEAAKAEDALLTRLEAAAAIAATSPTEGIATFGKNYVTSLPPEHTYVTGLLKEKGC